MKLDCVSVLIKLSRGSDLRREVANIKRLMEIGCYRGIHTERPAGARTTTKTMHTQRLAQ